LFIFRTIPTLAGELRLLSLLVDLLPLRSYFSIKIRTKGLRAEGAEGAEEQRFPCLLLSLGLPLASGPFACGLLPVACCPLRKRKGRCASERAAVCILND